MIYELRTSTVKQRSLPEARIVSLEIRKDDYGKLEGCWPWVTAQSHWSGRGQLYGACRGNALSTAWSALRALLRPLVSRPQQLPPLPNDGVEQLRRERMRAHLWHGDLRISTRRLL
jgi:hypothetical protein